MEILSGIAAATEAIKIAKSLRDFDKKLDEATFRLKIAELVDSLSDAKLALTDAKELISKRDKEVAKLKEGFELRKKLVQGNGDYKYFPDDEGKPVGYPICPSCEPLEGRIVQMKQESLSARARCPACMATFQPVTCYLPTGSAFRTVAEEEAQKHKEQSQRMQDKWARINGNYS